MSTPTVPMGWGRYWRSILMCWPNVRNSSEFSALLRRTFCFACLLSYPRRHPPAPSPVFLHAFLWIHLISGSVIKKEASGPGDLIQYSALSRTFLLTLGKLLYSKSQFQALHVWLWFLIWDPWGHLYFEIQFFFFFFRKVFQWKHWLSNALSKVWDNTLKSST